MLLASLPCAALITTSSQEKTLLKCNSPWHCSQRLYGSAGASGVGAAAIQIAKDVGAKVFITTSSQEKMDFCTVR